jgi:hypothetical protein
MVRIRAMAWELQKEFIGLLVGPCLSSEAIDVDTVNTDDSIQRLTHESLRSFVQQSCAPA